VTRARLLTELISCGARWAQQSVITEGSAAGGAHEDACEERAGENNSLHGEDAVYVYGMLFVLRKTGVVIERLRLKLTKKQSVTRRTLQVEQRMTDCLQYKECESGWPG
jgi:hypothetical protein